MSANICCRWKLLLFSTLYLQPSRQIFCNVHVLHRSPERHIVTTPDTDIEDVKWKSGTTDPVCDGRRLKISSIPFFFFFLDNGLQAWSTAWIMQKQLQLVHKRSTERIKHDMIKKKENKDVALTLACIIFTVKTMILTCKEEYSFFVKNKIQPTNLLYCLCQCVYDQLFFFFSVTCMSSHIFAKGRSSEFLTIRSVQRFNLWWSFCVHFYSIIYCWQVLHLQIIKVKVPRPVHSDLL